MNKPSGLLLVDKPLKVTSHDVIDEVRRLDFIEKAGHIGTLDPTAEGLVGVLINKATKLSQFFINLDKTYEIELEFGYQTDTLDQSGEVMQQVDKVNVTKPQIKEALKNFQGKIAQRVPKYSAVKKDGKKLYEYARENEEIELPERRVKIKQIDLKDFSLANTPSAKIRLSCSSGTYTRSLVRDLGQILDVYATQVKLVRKRIGKFESVDALDFGYIKKINQKSIKKNLITINEALYFMKGLHIKEKAQEFVKNGAPVRLKNLSHSYQLKSGKIVKIKFKDKILAIGKIIKDIKNINDPEKEILSYETVLA